MLLNFLYGLIGIILLTAFCLIGAFSAPQIAYWCMTPKAKALLEEHWVQPVQLHPYLCFSNCPAFSDNTSRMLFTLVRPVCVILNPFDIAFSCN